MNTQIDVSKVVLTRNYIRKFCLGLDCIGSTMKEDDLMEVSFLNNNIVIDTDRETMLIKLESQE